MAMNRQHAMDVDDATLDSLRALVGMSREDARTLVKQEGLDGLRIRVASALYAAEYLTSGEAADRVGLRNRGLLLQFLDDNHIAPVPDPTQDGERIRDDFRQFARELPCGGRRGTKRHVAPVSIRHHGVTKSLWALRSRTGGRVADPRRG